MKRRIVSTLTALALCLSLLPVPAMAAQELMADGGIIYSDSDAERCFGTAASVDKTSKTITLVPNAVITLTQGITLADGGWTLDLNGATLTAGADATDGTLSVRCTLTITGSGTVKGSGSNTVAIRVSDGALYVAKNAKLKVVGGDGPFGGDGIGVFDGTLSVAEQAELTVSGGKGNASSGGHGLRVGFPGRLTGNGTIITTGGNGLNGGDGIRIYERCHVSCEKLTATGGTGKYDGGEGVNISEGSSLTVTNTLTATGGGGKSGGAGVYSNAVPGGGNGPSVSAGTLNAMGGSPSGYALSGTFPACRVAGILSTLTWTAANTCQNSSISKQARRSPSPQTPTERATPSWAGLTAAIMSGISTPILCRRTSP